MRIDERLNLVLPVERTDGVTIHVHATPISREVFENYFLIIARTFSAIHGERLGAVGGPRIASLLLRKIAVEAGEWEGDGGVERGLVEEIVRLANVCVPAAKGWETIPLHDAMARGSIGPDEMSEVMNAMVFFIVISAMLRKSVLPSYLRGPSTQLWGASITSLNCTEYANSLMISTDVGNTGATAPA